MAVAHECDLALLTVHDDTFWQGEQGPMLPLELGEVPALQEAVLVCGFPTGGDNSSITSGVVSRCEVTQVPDNCMVFGQGNAYAAGCCSRLLVMCSMMFY